MNQNNNPGQQGDNKPGQPNQQPNQQPVTARKVPDQVASRSKAALSFVGRTELPAQAGSFLIT